MKKKYLVELNEQERAYLHKLISAGSAPARKLNRARILLKADVGKHAEGEVFSDRQIAQMLETSTATVQRERANAFTREASRLRWNALSLIGSTSALWRGAPKLT
jgi:hypothetical protein